MTRALATDEVSVMLQMLILCLVLFILVNAIPVAADVVHAAIPAVLLFLLAMALAGG